MNTWDKIQMKWNEILELFKEYDPKLKTLKTKLGGGNIPKLELADRGKKTESTNFIVTYDNEPHYSRGGHGADVLREFIRWVGVDNVYKLNIHANRNQHLISDIQGYRGGYSPKDVIGEYVIFTKSENKEKRIQIEEIIKGIDGIEATIEKDNS